MMIAKKAQLSWFVVLGLVFLIIIGIVSWLAYSTQFLAKKPQQVVASESDLNIVEQYVKGCEESLAEKALMLVGNQGGRVSPEEFLEFEGYKISIASKDSFPSLEGISREVATYMDENLAKECDVKSVTKKQVKYGKPSTKVAFKDKESVFETDWPVTVISDNNTKHSIGVIKLALPVRVNPLHEAVLKDLEEPGTDLSFAESLDSMDLKKMLYQDYVLNVLIDHKSKVLGKPYKFFYVENFK